MLKIPKSNGHTLSHYVQINPEGFVRFTDTHVYLESPFILVTDIFFPVYVIPEVWNGLMKNKADRLLHVDLENKTATFGSMGGSLPPVPIIDEPVSFRYPTNDEFRKVLNIDIQPDYDIRVDINILETMIKQLKAEKKKYVTLEFRGYGRPISIKGTKHIFMPAVKEQ